MTQISPTTSLLRSDESDNEVYLIGTAHISEASAEEVTDMISTVKPQIVFLELDPPRAARLRHSTTSTDVDEEEDLFEQKFQESFHTFLAQGGIPRMSGIGSFIQSNDMGEDMLKGMFSRMYRILKGYGYVPGIEMIAAMKEAERVHANLVYGDRDMNDTIRELRAAMEPSMIMKAMSTPPPPELATTIQDVMMSGHDLRETLGTKVEALKTRDHARLMTGWMNKAIPPIADVMIHRRDQVMAQHLRTRCGQGKVVAVVGLAHVDGIEREWQALRTNQLPP